MSSHRKKIIVLILFIALIAGLRFSGAGDSLTLDNLQQNRDALQLWVAGHRGLAVALYMLLYFLVVALSLPGGAVMTLAGGYLLGTITAVLCVILSATAGAIIAFLTARYLVGSSLQTRYRDPLVRFNAEMDRHGPNYLLTLRLIPLFPFFLVNFLSGLTRVNLGLFAWTTALGIVPGTVVFAFAGHQLESVRSVADILSPGVLTAFAVLAAFAFLPVVTSRFRKKP